MPQITFDDELYAKVLAFKPAVEAVLEKETGLDDCAALILGQGIDSMLADILGSVDQPTLLRSFQQLAARHPEAVYGFVTETLRGGAAGQHREEMRRRFGFRPPSDTEH